MAVWVGDPKKRSRRRAWPIHGYVGPNGSGKSAAMVWDTLPTLEAGRPALSTVRLLDYENPRPCEGERFDSMVQDFVACENCEDGDGTPHAAAHPLWVPFTDWQQLLDAERCDVLMDEVTGVASSRESNSLPAPVANVLVQLRRRDVTVKWSSPAWPRADKIIRETSQAVTHCVGYFPQEQVDVEGERLWRNRRLARWRTFDANAFEDFTVGKREQLRPMVNEWFRLGASGVFSAYDSFDSVLSIGTVSEGGSCYRCGGRRRAPECSCTDYRRGARRLQGAEAGAPEGSPERPAGPSPLDLPSRLTGHVHDHARS